MGTARRAKSCIMKKSVEPRKWAKAHFFVGVRGFRIMREEILAKVHEVAQRVGESEGIEIV